MTISNEQILICWSLLRRLYITLSMAMNTNIALSVSLSDLIDGLVSLLYYHDSDSKLNLFVFFYFVSNVNADYHQQSSALSHQHIVFSQGMMAFAHHFSAACMSNRLSAISSRLIRKIYSNSPVVTQRMIRILSFRWKSTRLEMMNIRRFDHV